MRSEPRTVQGSPSSAVLLLLLAIAVLAVFAQVVTFDFVRTDDPAYVFNNPRVLGGITLPNLVWALTSTEESNWHPLTWISLMLDAQLGGPGPRVFHLTNLLLHLANTLLLFHTMLRMTEARWRCFGVALLFGIHPLHVESVAWVAERKDVLSGLFWMLTILAYSRYRERGTRGRYALLCLTFALGLAAKPMLVTLPFVLLLLDYWPLRRIEPSALLRFTGLLSVLRDKIPLIVMSLLASAMTLYAQSAGGAMRTLEAYPVSLRLANAAIAYTRYMVKTIWPSGLALEYPYNHHPSVWVVTGSVVLLVASSAALTWIAARRPYGLVGWLWYVGTLVPVIGLIQVGRQGMADRYTYLPLIGLFVVTVWGLSDWVAGSSSSDRRRRWVAPVAGLLAVTLMFVAHRQAAYWADSVSLYTRAIAVTDSNVMAHTNLGVEFQVRGRTDLALEHYRRALEIEPTATEARVNLAAALLADGDGNGAIEQYSEVLRRSPSDRSARVDLANALGQVGRWDESIREYEQALSAVPDDLKALKGLGVVLTRAGRNERAAATFASALKLDPQDAGTYANLGIAWMRAAKLERAVAALTESLRLDPSRAATYKTLGMVRVRQGRIDQAVEAISTSLRLDPNQPTLRSDLERLERLKPVGS